MPIKCGSCSYRRWIYTYICNQSLSPLMLWVRIPLMASCTQYNIMWYSLLVTCGRSVVFSTNKTDRHDIAEIFLKVTLSTITLTQSSDHDHTYWWLFQKRFYIWHILLLVKLKSSLPKFYGRHHDLVDHYGISVSQMTTHMFHLS